MFVLFYFNVSVLDASSQLLQDTASYTQLRITTVYPPITLLPGPRHFRAMANLYKPSLLHLTCMFQFG